MSFHYQTASIFPRWTSRWTPLDVKHVSYCHVKPFRRVRKNGKAWIPKHSITTICLPISPAEHPTYIKDESGRRRSTPLDVKIPQLDVNWIPKLTRGASRTRRCERNISRTRKRIREKTRLGLRSCEVSVDSLPTESASFRFNPHPERQDYQAGSGKHGTRH